MKSKRELPFPDVKLEKKTIREANKYKLESLFSQIKDFNQDIYMLYDIKYEALVWYNG